MCKSLMLSNSEKMLNLKQFYPEKCIRRSCLCSHYTTTRKISKVCRCVGKNTHNMRALLVLVVDKSRQVVSYIRKILLHNGRKKIVKIGRYLLLQYSSILIGYCTAIPEYKRVFCTSNRLALSRERELTAGTSLRYGPLPVNVTPTYITYNKHKIT